MFRRAQPDTGLTDVLLICRPSRAQQNPPHEQMRRAKKEMRKGEKLNRGHSPAYGERHFTDKDAPSYPKECGILAGQLIALQKKAVFAPFQRNKVVNGRPDCCTRRSRAAQHRRIPAMHFFERMQKQAVMPLKFR